MNSSDANIIFKEEDHTLGNILSKKMIEDEDVLFAAYMVPHPLFRTVKVRVTTLDDTVETAVGKAVNNLVGELDNLKTACEKAFKNHRKK